MHLGATPRIGHGGTLDIDLRAFGDALLVVGGSALNGEIRAGDDRDDENKERRDARRDGEGETRASRAERMIEEQTSAELALECR